MSDVVLGKILEGEQHRDAVHIAIAPVVATEKLSPGQHIGFAEDGNTEKVCACEPARSDVGNSSRRIVKEGSNPSPGGKVPIGIVDPFLSEPVKKGQQFYMFLYPNTITSLRHEWVHPAFKEEKKVNDHEIWLRAYAMRMNSYETPDKAFETLLKGLRSSELFAHGSDLHGFSDLDDPDDLRMHAEAYLGIKLDAWGNFLFSCSC